MESGSGCPEALEAAYDPEDCEDCAAAVKGLPASPSKENDADIERIVFSSSPILDLSQKGLRHLGDFFKIPNLQQLYLQRNVLCGIPKDFFQLLPNLTWLDLRFNRLKTIPSGIGSHKHLKTLLLERNPIKVLPMELGQVSSLKALNLRHCPLEFPPQLIVQKGLVSILTFLRICSVEHTFPADKAPQARLPAKKMNLVDLPYPVPTLPESVVSGEEDCCPQDVEEAMVRGKADFFPPLRRLELSELRRPSEPCEHWPSEEEIRRFWKLRQEIVENEEAELLDHKLLAAELPPNLRAALDTKEKKRLKKGSSLRRKSILPNLPSMHQTSIRAKRFEESRMAALKELREKQVLMEQRRRDKRTLQEWREQTQLRRRRKELGGFQPPHRNMAASKIPFATDLVDLGELTVDPLGTVKQSRERAEQLSAEMSVSPLVELEEKIKQHFQQIRDRQNLLGSNPLQDVKTTTEDLDTAKKLQDEVRKLKLEMALNKERPFPALPGSFPPHLPASQPQNIFFNTKY